MQQALKIISPEDLVFDDFYHVGDLSDHTANGRGIFEHARAADFTQTQAGQRCALILWAADRASGLLDRQRGCFLSCHVCLSILNYASIASGAEAPSVRRVVSSPTFMPRFAAIMRGLSMRFKPSNVARTML